MKSTPPRRSRRTVKRPTRPLDEEFENSSTTQTSKGRSTSTKLNNYSPSHHHTKKKIAGGDSNTPTKTINTGSVSPHREFNSPRRKNSTTAISKSSPVRENVSFADVVANAKNINTDEPFEIPKNNNNNNVLAPPTFDDMPADSSSENTKKNEDETPLPPSPTTQPTSDKVNHLAVFKDTGEDDSYDYVYSDSDDDEGKEKALQELHVGDIVVFFEGGAGNMRNITWARITSIQSTKSPDSSHSNGCLAKVGINRNFANFSYDQNVVYVYRLDEKGTVQDVTRGWSSMENLKLIDGSDDGMYPNTDTERMGEVLEDMQERFVSDPHFSDVNTISSSKVREEGRNNKISVSDDILNSVMARILQRFKDVQASKSDTDPVEGRGTEEAPMPMASPLQDMGREHNNDNDSYNMSMEVDTDHASNASFDVNDILHMEDFDMQTMVDDIMGTEIGVNDDDNSMQARATTITGASLDNNGSSGGLDGGKNMIRNDPNTLIFDGATFAQFLVFLDAMDEVSRITGMKPSDLGRKSMCTFTEEEAIKAFGKATYTVGRTEYKFPKRGQFYCTCDKDCCFYVPFTYKEIKEEGGSLNTTKVYIVKGQTQGKPPRPLCLTHNHTTMNVGIDGWAEITLEQDMTTEEIEYVKSASTLNVRMPSLLEGMSLKFPLREFDSQLLHRILKRERESRLGPWHDRLPQLIELGELAKTNGGAWETVLCPETYTLQGTMYQTPRMRARAEQYGVYHATLDGTFGTNKYGLVCMPFMAPDCLGRWHCIGFITTRSENSKDVIAAGEVFGLSTKILDPNSTAPLEIDGVKLGNRSALNSYGGSLTTDRGPFSVPSAKGLGKDHTFCTIHETERIFASSAGLGKELKKKYIDDMYKLIYNIGTPEDLSNKIQQCLVDYAISDSAVEFIKTIDSIKEKICRAFTQNIFTANKTTTQGSEGFNNTVKGSTDLKGLLSNGDLVQLHYRIQNVSRRKDAKVKKILVKLRKEGKKWSPLYHSEVKQSMVLAGTNVLTCEKVSDDIYDASVLDGRTFRVNLATKIVHRGYIFVIPTCSCGYWKSSFRMCKCIVRSLTLEGRDVFVVKNVHPYYLLQFDPLWPYALQEAMRDNYTDFPNVNLTPDRVETAVTTVSQESMQVYTCPEHFFNQFGSRTPKSEKDRYTILAEACERLKKLAVDNGNEDTFRHAHARIIQATHEVQGEISALTGHLPIMQPPPPSLKTNAQRERNDAVNKSGLNRGKGNRGGRGRGGRGRGRGGSRGGSNGGRGAAIDPFIAGGTFCHMCFILSQNQSSDAGDVPMITFNDHTPAQCKRAEQYHQWVSMNADTNPKQECSDCQESGA